MKMSKEHIAIVMPWHISERGGGAEVQAHYLGRELVARGFKVTYICQTCSDEKVGSSSFLEGVEIRWLRPSGRFPWLDQSKYYKALCEVSPSIVVQRMSSNVTYTIGKYCRVFGATFAWICTDNASPYRNFHLRKYKEKFAIGDSNIIKYSIFLVNALVMDWLRSSGMKYINFAFSQNQVQEKLLVDEFGLRSRKMISGHPFPEAIVPAEIKRTNRKILWCANLGEHKRPEIFIELARQFVDRPEIRFIMVGGHSDNAYVKNLFENKPCNLELTGQISFEESLSYFDASSILVNTSVSEGFSNTYIQAWLRGLPTIVFGADPDNVIEKNHLGFSVATIEEAIEKINRLLTSFSEYSALSKSAEVFSSQNHSIKAMTDNFLDCIGFPKECVDI